MPEYWERLRDATASAPGSYDFRRISVAGSTVIEQRGAIGTAGSRVVHKTASPDRATALAQEMAESLLAEGFGPPAAATEGLCNALIELGTWDEVAQLAGNHSCPEHMLTALARHELPLIRRQVAGNPSTPPSALEALMRAHGDSAEILSAIASNPVTPRGLIAELSAFFDPGVRASAAANPSLDEALVHRFITDPNTAVRAAAARNPALTEGALSRLISDEHEDVRAAAAGSPAMSPDGLSALAADASAAVRKSVATNDATPPEVLFGLSADEDEYVVARVARNRNTPQGALNLIATQRVGLPRERAASHPLIPSDLLGAFFADADPYLRAAAAANPAASDRQLAAAASDTEHEVRIAVAGNHSTPAGVIARLSRDEEPSIRARAALHPCAPARKASASVLEEREVCVNSAFGQPGITTERIAAVAAERLVAHSSGYPPNVRILAGRTAAGWSLRAAACSEDPVMRLGAATNNLAGTDLREVLAVDLEPAVSAAAAHGLTGPRPPAEALHGATGGIDPSDVIRLLRRFSGGAQRALLRDLRSPSGIVAGLARSSDPAVRAAAAADPRLPRLARRRLLGDECSTVAYAAHSNMATAPAQRTSLRPRVWPRLSNTLVERVRADSEGGRRALASILNAQLARESWVDAAGMEILATSEENTDARVLAELLLADASLAYEAVAAAAPHVSVGTLAKVTVGGQRLGSIVGDVIGGPQNYSPVIRLRAGAGAIGNDLLVASLSPDPHIRRGLAWNPLAGTLLRPLLHDADSEVAGAALTRLFDAL